MARTSTYLNFNGRTEEAFRFYQSVFKTEFAAPIVRMGELPPSDDMPKMSESEKKMVMHVELPIVGGHLLHGNRRRRVPGPLLSTSDPTSPSTWSPTPAPRRTGCSRASPRAAR